MIARLGPAAENHVILATNAVALGVVGKVILSRRNNNFEWFNFEGVFLNLTIQIFYTANMSNSLSSSDPTASELGSANSTASEL